MEVDYENFEVAGVRGTAVEVRSREYSFGAYRVSNPAAYSTTNFEDAIAFSKSVARNKKAVVVMKLFEPSLCSTEHSVF